MDKRHPRLLFFLLYFCEGAPIGLMWWALPTLLRERGLELTQITSLTAALALPWAFKFLAGPFVDRWIPRKIIHPKVIALLQMLMGTCFLALSLENLSGAWVFVSVALLMGSLCGALQDVVIDAWAMNAIKPEERGKINGAMQAGMLTGRWLFGSGLLIVSHFFSLTQAAWFLAVVLWLIAFVLFFLDVHTLSIVKETKEESFIHFVKNIPKHKSFLLLIFVALFSGTAFESVGAIAGPFLVDLGGEKSTIGLFYSGSVICMLIGAVGGGYLTDRFRPEIVLVSSGLIIAICVSLLGFVGSSFGIAVVFLLILYSLIGFFTASSYTLFMNGSPANFAATCFTLLMALTNLCESGSAWFVAKAIVHYKYSGAFLIVSLISLIGLVPLYWYNKMAKLPSAEA